MATTELYDNQIVVSSIPVNVGNIVILPALDEIDAEVVTNLDHRRERIVRRAAEYRRRIRNLRQAADHYVKLSGQRAAELEQERVRSGAANKLNEQQRQQIADLETEIRGLEHTNELHLATINQQAAAIKELEEERLNLLIRQDFLTRAATRRGEIITILKARILALTAPDSGVQTQPAESEPVVRKVAQSLTDSS